MKKLTSILLILVLLISVLSTGVSAEGKTMTRNETAELIVTMCPPFGGPYKVLFEEECFLDATTEKYGAIQYLKLLQIIKGDGDGNVRPDDEILFEEAVVMFIRLLGYEGIAEANNKYPMGYLMTANNIGLTKGISALAGVSADAEDIKKMYENALDIPLRVFSQYDDDGGIIYKIDESQTLRKKMERYE